MPVGWRIMQLGPKTVRILRTVRAKNRTDFTYGDRTDFTYVSLNPVLRSRPTCGALLAARRGQSQVFSFERTGAPRLESKERTFGLARFPGRRKAVRP